MSSLKTFGIEEGKHTFHEEAIYSLALIYNIIWDEISSYLEPHALTPGKFNILMIIKHQGKAKGIPQVEISKRLILTPSNMTKLIDKLEKDGLVARFSLVGDRRVNLMKITPKGSRVLDHIWEGYSSRLKDLTHDLTKAQQENIAKLLKIWLSNLQDGKLQGRNT